MTPNELSDLTRWAAECASRVLASFESRHRADDRPRKALLAGQSWARGEISGAVARELARAAERAAHEAKHEAAVAAARACAEVAYISRGKSHAASAAAYARVALAAENPGKSLSVVAEELAWQQQKLPQSFRSLLAAS